VLTLHLTGAVGFLSDEGFIDHLDNLVEWCVGDAVIDCTGVTFIDSIGVGALVDAQRRLSEQGRRLCVVGLTATPRRVVSSMGLIDFLFVEDVEPTRAAPNCDGAVLAEFTPTSPAPQRMLPAVAGNDSAGSAGAGRGADILSRPEPGRTALLSESSLTHCHTDG
jgi:anti-anti-sigma factor